MFKKKFVFFFYFNLISNLIINLIINFHYQMIYYWNNLTTYTYNYLHNIENV